MVQFIGFSAQEEATITGMIDRLGADAFRMEELVRVERFAESGYAGKVVPNPAEGGMDMTMFLATCNPFTVAHELAHVSDISVRRQDALDHLSLAMPTNWHLAHRMTSEYYANRVACAYADQPHLVEALRHDLAAMLVAAKHGDWTEMLIYYALVLGIAHGTGQADAEPLRLLDHAVVPMNLLKAAHGFKAEAHGFFEDYALTFRLARVA